MGGKDKVENERGEKKRLGDTEARSWSSPISLVLWKRYSPFHALPLRLRTNKAQLRRPCRGSPPGRRSGSPANSLSAHHNVTAHTQANARPGLCLQTKNLWK